MTFMEQGSSEMNRKLIDEIVSLVHLGRSESEIKDELFARGYDMSSMDEMIAFSFRNLIEEKLTREALQHANEQAKRAEQEALEQKAQEENILVQKHKNEEKISSQQDDERNKQEEKKKQLIFEEDRIRKLEEEKKMQVLQEEAIQQQADEEQKLRQKEAEERAYIARQQYAEYNIHYLKRNW